MAQNLEGMTITIKVLCSKEGAFDGVLDDYATYLLELYEQAAEFGTTKHFACLIEKLDKLEGDNLDLIRLFLKTEIGLSVGFMQRLRLYDRVHPSCFVPKTRAGRALLNLMRLGSLRLVLLRRTWLNATCLELGFGLVES